MTPDQRSALLTQMVKIYNDKATYAPSELAMSDALDLAERFFTHPPEEPIDPPRSMRAMSEIPQSSYDAAFSIITNWLRFDVPKSVRPLITAELCGKLAAKLALMGG